MKGILCLMKRKILNGNAFTLGEEHRGWILGHFMSEGQEQHPELTTDKFEVRFSKHTKGDRREGDLAPDGFTVTILLHGRFIQRFPDENREVIQEKEGDFVYYGPRVKHNWEALEDSVMITFRSPSKK